jgi:mutual gliding-motility protein MglA
MAQWSSGSRTLFAKLVYYGPALGGKTTNLRALHRIVDPQATSMLLTIQTSDDRTLFFDLLPVEMGQILGHRVALKLYTVPGQVRYDATRRIVLAGADAVVFVADSSRGREAENRGSLENLRINLRANGLDPAAVPILFQFNKQDLADAAPPGEVARWLGTDPARGFPAVATNAEGVLETFIAAARAMVERLASLAARKTHEPLEPAALGKEVDRAFAPCLARLRAKAKTAPTAPAAKDGSSTSVVLGGDDLLEQSLKTSLVLGERAATENARAERLDREADALRRLSDSLRRVGLSFDRRLIADAALASAGEILGAARVTLVREGTGDGLEAERTWKGAADPLLGFPEGRALAASLVRGGITTVVDDLTAEIRVSPPPAGIAGLRAVAAVPVGREPRTTLLAYAPAPDGAFAETDVRFLSTVAGHLAAGLEKARVHRELALNRDRLEEQVRQRTEALQKACDELRDLDRMKDRLLSGLSHEMRSPIAAILSAATALRDHGGSEEQRAERLEAIAHASRGLDRLVGGLFRLVRLESGEGRVEIGSTAPEHVVARGVDLRRVERLRVEACGDAGPGDEGPA